jgi:hypothetical protein
LYTLGVAHKVAPALAQGWPFKILNALPVSQPGGTAVIVRVPDVGVVVVVVVVVVVSIGVVVVEVVVVLVVPELLVELLLELELLDDAPLESISPL